MRNVYLTVLVGVLAVALSARAGETYKGRLLVMDGGAVHNYMPVDLGDAGKSIANDFAIPATALLTVQCDGGAFVCVGTTSCTALTGVKVPADSAFPTSSKVAVTVTGTRTEPDGGSYCTGRFYSEADGGCTVDTKTSGIVTVTPYSGTTVSCGVWERLGNEM